MTSFHDLLEAQEQVSREGTEICLHYMQLCARRGNESVEELRGFAKNAIMFYQGFLGVDDLVTFYVKKRAMETTFPCIGRPIMRNRGFQHQSNVYRGMHQGEYFVSWMEQFQNNCASMSTAEAISYFLESTDGPALNVVTKVMDDAIGAAKYKLWMAFQHRTKLPGVC